jgi:hypothetical protein
MKFDQALKEGFDNYVSEDEEKIAISRDVLQAIKDLVSDNDIIALAVDKHKENPSLHANISKLYFAVDDLLKPSKDEDYEGMVKTSKRPYDVDKAVEQHARQAGKLGSITGVGTRGQASKAVGKRDKLVKQAIDVYNKNTSEIEQALRDAS